MKAKFSLVICLGAIASTPAILAQALNLSPAPAAAPAAAPAPTVGAPVTAPAATFTETQVLETIGWILGRQGQVDTFQLTPAQVEAVQRGFALAAADRDSPHDLEKIGAQLQRFVDERNTAYHETLKKKGNEETAALFTRLRAQTGVTVLPSGLAFEIMRAGTGANARTSDTIVAHYTATLPTGETFDTSRTGETPTPVDMPVSGSLPGLEEGMQKINKGGRIKLYIPPSLAFGDNGASLQNGAVIPPATTVIFDLEVVDIKPTPGPASLTPMVTPLTK